MRRLLFSPGPVYSEQNIKIDFHHRSEEFHKLYIEKSNLIRDTFFNQEYDVLFTQGSGTSAIETAINGLVKNKRVLILDNGTFSNRIVQMCKNVGNASDMLTVENTNQADFQISTGKWEVFICVCFETSKSIKNSIGPLIDRCNNQNMISIVDMVSALGFYEPSAASVICSSSAKILRGLPVMGILAYRKDIEDLIDGSQGFYLNFKRYIDSKRNNETPHTSLLPQILSINEANFATPTQIIENCLTIENNYKFVFLGDRIAPVLTLCFTDTELMQHIIDKITESNIVIYYNAVYMKNTFQIGMFNHAKEDYEFLNTIIQNACGQKY
jgi:2-aminoethylphosphonate-pyruvate transaminase